MSKLPKQRSHFGMAGHFAAMSEFLLRGWNVAVPAVDVGDDVLVLADDAGDVRRVQVKTASGRETRDADGVLVQTVTQYSLSRSQLATLKAVELHYMLMVRWDHRWRFILIRRDALAYIRQQLIAHGVRGPGRPPVADDLARGDDLVLRITWRLADAEGWDASLAGNLDTWPEDFPELRVDPPPLAPAPLLSLDLETPQTPVP